MKRTRRARYTLRADVSEFYRSVYTHSLEWALHTKAAAKAALRAKAKSAPLLGAVLDENVRRGQDGQTKGIPIGPDTSLLLAEVIMCAIDAEIQREHPTVARFGIRFMDDFEFAALTRSEAEDVLLTWDTLLSAFDLTLNPLKTAIYDGPMSPEEHWQVQLKHFQIRDETDQKQANDIRSLFSLAFQLSRENPTSSVLKYAVRRCGAPSGGAAWSVYSDMVLSAIVTDPSAVEAAYTAFSWAKTRNLSIDLDGVSETLNEMCRYHAPLEHGSEVAWSLYILREHGLKVSSQAAMAVAAMRDNCSLLLLLEADAAGMIDGVSPNLSSAIARAEDVDTWFSEDWILAYEAGRHRWANDAAMKAQPHWAELRKLGVAFFAATTLPAAPIPSTPAPVATPAAPDSASTAPAPAAPGGGVGSTPGDRNQDDEEGDGEEYYG